MLALLRRICNPTQLIIRIFNPLNIEAKEIGRCL